MTQIIPAIMSGGAGTRLWPLARVANPKQLHALMGERTMLRETLERFSSAPDVFQPSMIVCAEGHETIVREQLADMDEPPRLILEPMGRNTAACAAVVAYWVAAEAAPDSLVLLAPADHLVSSAAAFADAVRRAIPAARDGRLVSLGVRPTHPETGYGYIRLGEPIGDVFEAAQFVEKPDRATAERYLAHGGYLWNGGYFLFRADRMIAEMERHAPEIAARAREALERGAPTAAGGLLLNAEAFAAAPSDSVDYAVMEKTDQIAVAPLDAGWSDVGSWASVWDASAKDEDGNVLIGDALAIGSSDCLIRSDSRLIAAVGVKDLVIVAAGDAVLVVPRGLTQDVKKIVNRLADLKRHELL